MMLRALRGTALLILLLGLAGACTPGKADREEGAIPVVATIFPVADLVRNVGGEHVSVSVLLPAGASPHTFDPTPGQVRRVADAKAFFEIGAGLEYWSDRVARASGNRDLRVVTLSNGLDLLCSPGGHGCEHGHAHAEHAPNPHVWLDPHHAIRMVESIASALAGIDPDRASDYRQNADAYARDLRNLDKAIRESVDTFHFKRYVAFHSAWVYFAHRYGLEPAGIIEESPGKEATPKHLEGIIATIRAQGIPVVFAETQLNPKEAEVIAREAGVEIALLDPLGGENVEGRDSYLSLMRYNLGEMQRTLGR
jgi:zinc transport system substrate-binding protein